MKRTLLVIIGLGIVGGLCLLIAIQLIPYGRNHTNPPVSSEPAWDKPETREIAVRACFDCHSNETTWPWYSNIAPVSWLVYRDVEEGRDKLNFSKWGQGEQEVDELIEVLQEGEMPMPVYLITHPEARLKTTEKQTLIQGFQNTFGISGEEGDDRRVDQKGVD